MPTWQVESILLYSFFQEKPGRFTWELYDVYIDKIIDIPKRELDKTVGRWQHRFSEFMVLIDKRNFYHTED